MSEAVIDASAMVDFLLGRPASQEVAARMRDVTVHAPAHFDAEVLSALGRLHRGGHLSADDVTELVGSASRAPIIRHPLPPLLQGAWARRSNSSVMDALYLELADQLDLEILTTDARMAATTPRATLLQSR